jgi:hypothetical protein
MMRNINEIINEKIFFAISVIVLTVLSTIFFIWGLMGLPQCGQINA